MQNIDNRILSDKKKTVSAFILFILAAIIYLPTLWHLFAWDDSLVISSEIHSIKGYDLFIGKGDYYRPFLALFHGLDFALWHDKPFGFHLTNILLNSLCVVIVYIISSRLFGEQDYSLSLIPPLIFAFHPTHADSVSWIAGRTDIIATLFLLFAFLAYQLYREENDRRVLSLSALFFLFSLFGKETGILFPAIALSYDMVIKGTKGKDSIRFQVPFLIVIMIYFILRKFPSFGNDISSHAQGSDIQITRTIFNDAIILIKQVSYSLGFYINKLVVPVKLTILNEIHTAINIIFLSGFILIFITAFIKKARAVIFGLIFIILTILPSLPVAFMDNVPSPVAVRYLYLPVFGFALLIAYGIGKINRRHIRWAVLVLLLVLYGFPLHARTMSWSNNLSLWMHETNKNPDFAMAHSQLSIALYNEKKHDEAEKKAVYVIQYINSLKANRHIRNNILANAYNTLGMIYMEKKDFDTAENYLLKGLLQHRKNRSLYHNLGTVYLSKYIEQKEISMLNNANYMYDKASTLDPFFINSQYGLAYTYQLLGRNKEAVEHYKKVIDIDPRNSMAFLANKAIKQLEK